MKKQFFYLAISVLLLSGAVSFAQSNDWQTSPSGMKHKFFVKNEKAKSPVVGDMVTVVGYYKVKDTIFFDSRKSPTPYIFPIVEPTYKGDIFDGLKMMHIGDSAVFALSGEDLFMKSFKVKSLPNYVPAGAEVLFYVKLLKIQPKEEFQKEMQAKFEAENKKSAEQASKDDSLIKLYIKKNRKIT
ncbi:MAG: hypothetical protein NTU44_18820 [Bacteroidetes bacterium]|nr:hypothetical protein [Bacteroidota bacterium]